MTAFSKTTGATAFAAMCAFTSFSLVPSTSFAEEFRWAGSQDATTLDPHTLNQSFILGLLGNVYEPLVQRDANFEISPALATEWEMIEPTVWRFKLREGVSFSNGNAFTADDVVFSIQRGMMAGTKNMLATVAEARKVDDYTVELVTKSSDPILPLEITNLYIMDSDWATENNSTTPAQAGQAEENYASRNTVGTGPFMIEMREPGVSTSFVPNPTWWGKPEHNLDRATYFVIANSATRVSALKAGEIDAIQGLGPQDVGSLELDSSITVLKGPELRTMWLMPDMGAAELPDSGIVGTNPFADLNVRKAMLHAIDSDAIIDRILRGYAIPVGSMMSSEINGYTSEIDQRAEYDVDLAKEYLAKSAYPDGFSVTLDCTNDRFVMDEAICIAVASMLGQIGIDVTPRAQTVSKWAETINPPAYGSVFTMAGYSPSTNDAHNLLATLLATRNPDAGLGIFNLADWKNPRIDELTVAIQSEANPAMRQAMITEAFTIARDEVAYIPLHQQMLLWAHRNGVSMVQLPDDRLRLDHVRVD